MYVCVNVHLRRPVVEAKFQISWVYPSQQSSIQRNTCACERETSEPLECNKLRLTHTAHQFALGRCCAVKHLLARTQKGLNRVLHVVKGKVVDIQYYDAAEAPVTAFLLQDPKVDAAARRRYQVRVCAALSFAISVAPFLLFCSKIRWDSDRLAKPRLAF